MIDSFQGKHRWLSNFWPAQVAYDGQIYPTVEHAYVASKTLDLSMRGVVCSTTSPGHVKRLGKNLVLRPNWENLKYSIMEYLVTQKFYNHKDLREMLLSTGDMELVEGNGWGDTYWGVCNGVGQNHLGKILMKVRKELQEDS
jgi:N-glycosidase YbiA